MTDEKRSNEFGKSLQEWWDSDAFKQLHKAHKEDKERAIGKYHMLSEEDKIDMVNAICHIMCEAEKMGTSHRGLMDSLGIYPAGFWIDDLMDVHNSLWKFFHDKKKEKQIRDTSYSLDEFIKENYL
jgi:hypothetical protein